MKWRKVLVAGFLFPSCMVGGELGGNLTETEFLLCNERLTALKARVLEDEAKLDAVEAALVCDCFADKGVPATIWRHHCEQEDPLPICRVFDMLKVQAGGALP